MVPSVLEQTVLERIAKRLEELVSRAVAAWAADPGLARAAPEGDGVVGAQLELADPDFAPCCEHPLVAEAATAVLGPDWHVSWLGVRVPLPGNGRQRLHRDFEQHRSDGPWQVLSAMWCITEFTQDNGPLRVLPGSHRVSEPPLDLEGWGMKPHPDEVKVAAPAGSLILFNSADLWHSGTGNNSPAPRLALTAGVWPGGGPCHLHSRSLRNQVNPGVHLPLARWMSRFTRVWADGRTGGRAAGTKKPTPGRYWRRRLPADGRPLEQRPARLLGYCGCGSESRFVSSWMSTATLASALACTRP